ncbi:hypothetical protein JHK82_036635 [Glycine max]|uniref:Ubiquitin-like domain-containing protein n=1 Tax=Glycine max TaxID=3847 RepID=K7M0D5_SOYBN|nr:hypothetical protein JHK82_036635 [Glycine max]
MEVILEILGGNSFFIDVGPSFFIEVGPLDTVLDVKEKVQTLHNIPISYQTFLFNGEVLQDDLQVSTSGIDRGSRIGLLVAPPDDANLAPPQPTLRPPWHTRPFGMPEFPPSLHLNIIPHVYDPFGYGMPNIPEFSSLTELRPMPQMPQQLPSSSTEDMLVPSNSNEFEEPLPDMMEASPPSETAGRVTLNVKVHEIQDRIPIEMEFEDTVLKVKEKIVAREDMRGVPLGRIALQSYSAGVELLDHQVLQDCCAILENNEIDVFLKPTLEVAGGSSRNEFEEPLPEMTAASLPSETAVRVTLYVKMPDIQGRIPVEMEFEDTILKVKEKIVAREDMRGVPVDRIALHSHSEGVELLDHQVLQDCCAVLENNEIDAFSKTCPEKRMVNVKLPMSQNRIRIEVEVNDTFQKLKEKIVALEEMQGVPVERILLYPCSPIPESVLNPIFYVYLKSSVPVAGRAGGGSSSASSGKMTVYLKPNGRPKCYPLQVNAVDNVSALGQQLGRLLRNSPHRLPHDEAFFMVHRGEWMNEQESFEWHGVRNGTKIATFVGRLNDSVTPILRPKSPS